MEAKKKPKDQGEFSTEPRPRKGEPERLKIEGSWEDTAKRLLSIKPGAVTPRKVKARKKRAKK